MPEKPRDRGPSWAGDSFKGKASTLDSVWLFVCRSVYERLSQEAGGLVLSETLLLGLFICLPQ